MAHRIVIVTQFTRKTFSTSCRTLSSRFFPVESEYTDEPCYPPIIDLSSQAKINRKADAVGEIITSLPTVEEKLIELNAPKYYGWLSCQLSGDKFPYNVLPFAQFATRTCLAPNLPSIYSDLDGTASKYVSVLRDSVKELILQEFEFVAPR